MTRRARRQLHRIESAETAPKRYRSPSTAHPAPVIALQCSGAGAGQWRQLRDTLDAHYERVAPEHYGCDSTGPWTGQHAFTLADEAARTIEIIDRSGGKVHLVGRSGSATGFRRPRLPSAGPAPRRSRERSAARGMS